MPRRVRTGPPDGLRTNVVVTASSVSPVTEIGEPTTKPVMTVRRAPTYPALARCIWGKHERSVAVAGPPPDRGARPRDPGAAQRTPTADARTCGDAPPAAAGRVGSRRRDGRWSGRDPDRRSDRYRA